MSIHKTMDGPKYRAMKQGELLGPKLIEFFKDEENVPYPTAVIFYTLKMAGFLRGVWQMQYDKGRAKAEDKEFDDDDVLSPNEQLAVIKKKLYEKAKDGDLPSIKEWRENFEELERAQIFNVKVDIKDYKIRDTSLQRIAMQAERQFVHQILMGLADRLRMDHAPQEMQDSLVELDEKFQAWAYEAYQPRNA